jgi:hypothetical protein
MTVRPHVAYIGMPNPWGRRYRVLTWPGSGTEPELYVEVFTASRGRIWRHIKRYGPREAERARVLAYHAECRPENAP